MTAVYLRAGIWVVVVVGVVCGVAQSRPYVLPQGFAPPSLHELLYSILLKQTKVGGSLQIGRHLFSPGSFISESSQLPPGNVGDHSQTVFPQLTRADLRRRGSVTFVMQHGPASYFLEDGEQKGFEYELAETFGRELGIRVDIVTLPPGADAIVWLHEGKGDILAGVVTTGGTSPGSVIVSRPYFETPAYLITRSEESTPRTLAELAEQSISLRVISAGAHRLWKAAQDSALRPVLPVIAGEDSIREMLSSVINGHAAATVLMDPLVPIAHAWYPGRLRTAWTLPQSVSLAWAVRPGQTELLRAIDTYLERVSRSGVRKILIEKYFLPSSALHPATRASEGALGIKKRISRYDQVIALHAEEAGFDWRFVAALIFEESRFDHNRVSSEGASGLMQLMPFTAQLVGVKNVQDPHANIEAGVKYLSFLSRRLRRGSPHDRLALILAGYVMGLGHVEDAQRIARLQGYDSDCWADMEQILPLLEEPKYHSKTLFGYAQGREAVRYANAILRRYEIYTRYIARDFPPAEARVMPETQAASAVAG
jgi:membrane-bound lytic murein transglycosylase F